MIRKLILSISILVPFFGLSKGEESIQKWWIIKDSVSGSIHRDSVKLVVRVYDLAGQLLLDQHPAIIQSRIDNKVSRHTISATNTSFQCNLAKGRRLVNFYLNANFEQINFDYDFTSGGRYLEIGIIFPPKESNERPVQIMLEKPVIYLYSETEQEFELKLKTDADLQFTYPVYEGEWKGTASPDGMIQIAGSSYPYLFWDAQLPVERLELNWQNSDQILGEQTLEYLSACLDKLGFNPKEKSDFITYWGPRMQNMKYVQILWLQNEALNNIASLELSPGFTQNRVYIVFKETGDLVNETLQLKLNTLKPVDRTKNCLVEWGGIEIQSNL